MNKGLITEYLSTYANTPIEYGTVDCHIMALTVIDMIMGTQYKNEIYQKYKSASGGRKYAKDNCTYPTLKKLCEAKGELVDTLRDGDILLASDHCTVFWREKVIVLNEEKVFKVQRYSTEEQNYKVYRFTEE